MYNPIVVEVYYSRESGLYKVRGIGFVVVTFIADAVKKLPTKGKVGY